MNDQKKSGTGIYCLDVAGTTLFVCLFKVSPGD